MRMLAVLLLVLLVLVLVLLVVALVVEARLRPVRGVLPACPPT